MEAITLAILKGAKEKIVRPLNWTRYTDARDANGTGVHFSHSTACRFCLLGAIKAVNTDPELSLEAREFIKRAIVERPDFHKYVDAGGVRLDFFNDQTDHKNVLKILDRAMVLAEKSLEETA